jgi:hypothetical protein
VKLNNKGYSLIELFAVIFIATAIIFPLVTTLVNNFEINDRLHRRRAAVSIQKGTLDGFSRINFIDIRDLVNTANTGGTYFVEFDGTTCNQLPDSADEALCNELFNSVFNNVTLTEDEFKIYIHSYYLTSAMKTSLTSNNAIPLEIREYITDEITVNNNPNPDLYYIYIWIEYDTDTSSTEVLGGLLSNE